MERTSHEQRAESSKRDREARQGTQQAMERRRPPPLAANPFVSPFGFLSAFWGDMDRIVRGFGLPAPFSFRSGFGGVSPNQAGSSGSASALPTWAPPLEVLTRDGEFVVRAEIPGIDKEHVNVEIEEGRAVISGERKEEHEDKGEGFYRSERSYGRFSCVVALPEGTNAEEAKAMSADGVLEIVIPMANPEHKGHRLEIHEGSAQEPQEPGNGAQQEAEQQSQSRRGQPPAKRHRKGGR
jgi:HSP20 family protein